MELVRQIVKMAKNMCGYSRICIKMGAIMMLCFYITALTAYIIAPYVPNYHGAMSALRGCMEAAPASLAAGLIAAVICDLIVASQKEDSDKK